MEKYTLKYQASAKDKLFLGYLDIHHRKRRGESRLWGYLLVEPRNRGKREMEFRNETWALSQWLNWPAFSVQELSKKKQQIKLDFLTQERGHAIQEGTRAEPNIVTALPPTKIVAVSTECDIFPQTFGKKKLRSTKKLKEHPDAFAQTHHLTLCHS